MRDALPGLKRNANGDVGGQTAAKRVKQGFDFVNLGEDVVGLSAWMGAQMDELKELLK